MASEPSGPEAGWYPTPSGEKRFWDGEKWLALPQPEEMVTSPQTPAVSSNIEPESNQVMAPDAEPVSAARKRKMTQRRKWIAIVAATVVVLGLAGGGIAWKAAHDNQVAAEANAVAEAAAKAEADREAAVDAAKRKADAAERATRAAGVDGIEASIKTMAEGHAADGAIDGPIIDATCSPVGGGSMDDLTESTTVFECFVANKDNGDGTMSGYNYNATMNWTTGSYTYGMGSA